MDNKKYREVINSYIEKYNIENNYIKSMTRQLKIFYSIDKKKQYIDGKTKRIMEDHSIYCDIRWRNNTDKKVLLNNKTGEVSFSTKNLEAEMLNFLTDIPYFLSLHYYNIARKQDLTKLSTDDWLSFFSNLFFQANDIIKCSVSIKKILSTCVLSELKNNKYYNTITPNYVRFFEKNGFKSFLFNNNDKKALYLYFGKKHHLFDLS